MTSPPTADRRMFTHVDARNDGSFVLGDWTLFLTIAGVWGSSFLLIDVGLDALPPGVITSMRVALGAATLWAMPARFGQVRAIRVAPDDRARLALLSVLWVAIPFTLFPIAEQSINSAVTGLLNGATPIWAAIVSTVLVRRPPTGRLLAGIVVGFAGIVLISLPSIGDGGNATTGVLLVLTATLCYGFALNLAPGLQQRYGSMAVMARMLALGTLWTAPAGLWQLRDAHPEVGPLAAVAALGVVGTGIAFAMMGALVAGVGSTRASFTTYLIPVVSLVLGVVVRGDEVSPWALAGIAAVLTGALLAARGRHP